MGILTSSALTSASAPQWGRGAMFLIPESSLEAVSWTMDILSGEINPLIEWLLRRHEKSGVIA